MRRHILLCFLILNIIPTTRSQSNPLRVDTANGELTISNHTHSLLTYVYRTVYPPPGIDTAYKKSGFIHPLYTPHGQILTSIQPPDHYHHYGIWDPWTHILYKGDTIDCWNLAARKGTQRFGKFSSISSNAKSAKFQALQQHVAFHKDGTEEVFLNELLTATITPADPDHYLLDLTIELTPATAYPVTLLAYRYGGLGWRATAEWNRDNSEVLTSEGMDRRHADNSKARWCIVQGALGNDYGGIAMLSHPDNFNHPEPLRIWPDTSNGRGDLFANFSPTKDRDWFLEPGHTYTLRYRWIVFNGHFTKQQAESAWYYFAHPPHITTQGPGLPPSTPGLAGSLRPDWLVEPANQPAEIFVSGKDIVLENGLVRRTFRMKPNLACTDYSNLSNGQQLLRAVKPEARVVIDGKEYQIGGLEGQKENAYLLPEWVDSMHAGKDDFLLSSYHISDLQPFLHWRRTTWAMNGKQAKGKQVDFIFVSGETELAGIRVVVHYELYDGLPLIVKWVSVENRAQKVIRVDRVVNEVLGLVEEESAVVGSTSEMKKQHGIYVETNYAFNNAMRYDISDQTTHWKADPAYTSQVNYDFQTPCLLEVYPDKVSGIELRPGEDFKSVRTHELLMDSYDRQRRGLMIKRMYRTVAPWTTQNPIFMHLVSRNDDEVRRAVDQCVATGYEAVILSFGSHLNMEDSSAANIERWSGLATYAHRKGILLGGYSLFSSRRISDEDDVIDPKTGKPGGAFFGNAPCFGSKWGLAYRDKIKYFFEKTKFDIWENDGPYAGDVCASTSHPGHKGLDDSQWKQMEIQKELYHWLNARGVYINAPDWYFLDGTNKIGIGYREVNFSLPREQQLILNRQNIYDGLLEKTGSMSWGFVPLTKYQGGGADAVLEPLAEHLKDYKQLMVEYYGAGVQACYRGPRLYDTDTTRKMVTGIIHWYKAHREILNSDVIELRRADGRDWDGLIHVNPALAERGLIMLYNPTHREMTKTIMLPLYYTGLTKEATIYDQEGRSKVYPLDRNDEVAFTFTIRAEDYCWFIVK